MFRPLLASENGDVKRTHMLLVPARIDTGMEETRIQFTNEMYVQLISIREGERDSFPFVVSTVEFCIILNSLKEKRQHRGHDRQHSPVL